MKLIKADPDYFNKLKSGELTTEQVLSELDSVGKHIKDIEITDFTVKVLDSGLATFDEAKVLKDGVGELIVLAARPSHGKSALMFQTALGVAQHSNVLGISLEMSTSSLIARLIASESGKSLTHIQDGFVDQKTIDLARKKIDKSNLYLFEKIRSDLGSIVSCIRDTHKKYGLKLVVIDYLQLITHDKKMIRDQEIGIITGKLKELALEIEAPIVVGSQLNRACESRGATSGDFKPQLSDLRESGNIEQDADVVVMLSRHEQHKPGERTGEADIGIVKNRNGATMWAIFKYAASRTKFYDINVGGRF